MYQTVSYSETRVTSLKSSKAKNGSEVARRGLGEVSKGLEGAQPHLKVYRGWSEGLEGESKVVRGHGIKGETGLEPWQTSEGDSRVELDSKRKGGLEREKQTFQRLFETSYRGFGRYSKGAGLLLEGKMELSNLKCTPAKSWSRLKTRGGAGQTRNLKGERVPVPQVYLGLEQGPRNPIEPGECTQVPHEGSHHLWVVQLDLRLSHTCLQLDMSCRPRIELRYVHLDHRRSKRYTFEAALGASMPLEGQGMARLNLQSLKEGTNPLTLLNATRKRQEQAPTSEMRILEAKTKYLGVARDARVALNGSRGERKASRGSSKMI
ncbi:hypothetical protein BKA83DRAFT_4126806 [Pisolithus microcarpus]|nr:hypothetical protein BKA83DRAFT_4126806 [Pisolithus microcarpus]